MISTSQELNENSEDEYILNSEEEINENMDNNKIKWTLGDKVEVNINGQFFIVGEDVGDMSLNTFIRERAHFKGTKFMCLEGGCGACIVSAHFTHPSTHKKVTYAVNSCLVPVLVCHGWEIRTVEGIGNRFMGYHKIQKRLAGANGSQCGYCSPGMVMNMYSLLKKNPNMTMKEIENSFGGNICRCTGYRPILDAFKSFASDASQELIDTNIDIEDAICPKNGGLCTGACRSACDRMSIETIHKPVTLTYEFKNGTQWYRPVSVHEICEIFDKIEDKSYRFVAGNTGHGVYRIDPKPDVYIDINGVTELHSSSIGSNCISLGANVCLTETMEILSKGSKNQPSKFGYCQQLVNHMDLVASVPVRNVGTLAGNLSLKHTHKEFQSDVFLLLETVGAKLVIHESEGLCRTISLTDYLRTDMKKKIITQIILPSLSKDYKIDSFKIMPRSQNAHAIVNAGFLFRFDRQGKCKIVGRPSIVFGGINGNFIHATNTEEYLNGKTMLLGPVLEKSLNILSSELNPVYDPLEPSPEYRKGLALSLFYKFVLSLAPDLVESKYKSGGSLLERELSRGTQTFDTNKDVWPLNKQVPKIEGLIQTAGEAEYTNDIPNFPGEVWGQLVLCDKGGTEIINIDPSAALALPGVIAFYQAKDLPGINSYSHPNWPLSKFPEKIFASGKTDYAGQAVGIIIAESLELATSAVNKVKIIYGKSDTIMVDFIKIVKDNVTSRIIEAFKIEPTAAKDNIKYQIKGELSIPSQYHYYMEPLSCVSVPSEDCLDVFPSSQWPNSIQDALSKALNIPDNKLNVRVRRLGGGYGGKISLPNQNAIACSLAALKLHRPVRLVVNLETGMSWGGMRHPAFTQYEAGVDENGAIQRLDIKVYQNCGFSPNDSPMAAGMTIAHLPNCYDKSTWTMTYYNVMTDTASNTWCRAPGSFEATTSTEYIMEHIAKVTNIEPIKVRLANMADDHPCVQLSSDIREKSDFESRLEEIKEFNRNNRWKKRGISHVLMEYPFMSFGKFHGSVSIYKNDGTVSISHGAVEMGQGCNTKAAQVAAHILGIDLDSISVRPVDTFISPNNNVTGASIASECVCLAIQKSCEELNERLKPVKDKLGPNAKWLDVITEANQQFINLRASYLFTQNEAKPYHIYGSSVVEVECDILTGQYMIKRVDLIEDAGESLSPGVDIGQVEGAFLMGYGALTSEQLIRNDQGKVISNRTWFYKPPGAKDIPIDWRITLRKNSSNPLGVLRSKATGEPPLNLSSGAAFALRNALESARRDAGNNQWFPLELPLTTEKAWLGVLNNKEIFKI